MSGEFITTYSGRHIDLKHPNLRDIPLSDFVVALSRINRFNGHTSEPYSVAEHSVYCADLILNLCGSRETAWCALFHDAHEAIVGDVSLPLKQAMGRNGPFDVLERRMMQASRERFHCLPDCDKAWDLVHQADMYALIQEREALMSDQTSDWKLPEITEAFESLPVHPVGAANAYDAFLCKVEELM